MKKYSLSFLSVALLALVGSLTVFAQTTTAPITGSVTDQNGATISGAVVTAKKTSTGAESRVTSTSNGTFSVPALDAGDYTLTIETAGFKKAVVQNVKIEAGVPASVNVTLEVGAATESVVVQGGGEILQTQSANVSTTLSTTQIAQLPLQSRNTIYFLTLLPGVSSSATASPRNSTINGLPSSAYNITIDGLNTQDNLNKNGDGFFSYIAPSVDSVQEVTLSTATPGAESGGQGAIQIKFTTRQGTNKLNGSLYYYHRNTALNSNYWFTNRDNRGLDVASGQLCQHFSAPTVGRPYDPNVCKAPKAKALFHQYGGRVGGPIVIPKLFNGRDKAFFFVNYEEFRQPNEVARTRNILSPATQAGTFQYVVSGQTRTVDLLALARANGQTAAIDPIVGKLLSDIRSSTASTGGVVQLTDPNLQSFSFQNGSAGKRYLPTTRFDFNLTSKHTLSNTYNYHSYFTSPDTLNSVDPAFPGFPNIGSQASNRFSEGLTLRSLLSPTIVNEARVGLTGGTVLFYPEVGAGQFANQGGFSLGISAATFNGTAISNPTVTSNPQRRNSPVWDYADTVTWSRGAHNLSFGGQFTQISLFNQNQTVVPAITFGIAPGDSAAAMFNATNFPGANATNLTNAQSLYAVLTGRITAITANAVLDEKTNKYTYLAPRVQRVRQKEFGLFVADSWRARPNLTLTGGVRWELQKPFTVENEIYSGPATINDLYGYSGPTLFKPSTTRVAPDTQFVQVKKGSHLYNTQWNNFAPSVGFAWTPAAKDGWLKRVLGDGGQTVLRGGYSIAYERQGTASPINFYGANPGITVNATRSTAIGNLAANTAADPFPVLLSQTTRLGPSAFAPTPSYPFTGSVADQVNVFEPNLKTPYAQSWSFGIQREITKDMVVEARYVHTFNLQEWTTYQFNETNIVENGFLNEFKLAQANLAANIAAGRGNTFAYTGAPGTSPLPIYLAYFQGAPNNVKPNPNATTSYTSANFTSANFTGPLAFNNPAPYTTAGTNATQGLQGNATFRSNAIAAGLAPNFFVVNPGLLGGTFIQSNGGFSKYDALQIDMRRRMSKGLLLAANYTFAKGFAGNRYSFRQGWVNTISTLNGGTIKHAFKANWVYELPLGKGRWLLGKPNGFVGGMVDKAFGGWEFDGTARIQTGANLNLGNVNLVGMTQKDLQKAYKLRFDDAKGLAFIFPQDVIDNTIKAFSVSATTTSGYPVDAAGVPLAPTGRYIAPANNRSCIQVVTGDCAPQNVFLIGPRFTRFDLSMIKRFQITEERNFAFRAEFLNAFNHVNFLGNTNLTNFNGPTFGQVTSSYRDQNNTQDPGGRLIQFVGRFNF
ncbi:MAG: carboxypeptidase regulatory-like domain-containing protein [Acidobacteria bacterium]|nr:carboxypeptidase regulatory-like domain-containing protein [Acidobacteriota bacterium]